MVFFVIRKINLIYDAKKKKKKYLVNQINERLGWEEKFHAIFHRLIFLKIHKSSSQMTAE